MDTNTQQTDEEIAAQVQGGTPELFGVLISRYEARMHRYANKFLSNGDDKKDIVQEVFIKAFINIRGFDTTRKFSPWLYRIAHNELVNALRKKKFTLPIFDADTFFPYLHRAVNPIDEELDRSQTKKIINDHLDALPQKYKEPLILYYLEELSYKEIADVLRMPVATVGVRIQRAKKSMQSMLKNQPHIHGT